MDFGEGLARQGGLVPEGRLTAGLDEARFALVEPLVLREALEGVHFGHGQGDVFGGVALFLSGGLLFSRRGVELLVEDRQCFVVASAQV